MNHQSFYLTSSVSEHNIHVRDALLCSRDKNAEWVQFWACISFALSLSLKVNIESN